MAKIRDLSYRCDACGLTAPRWVGRCSECQTWGSVVEIAASPPGARQVAAGAVSMPARPIAEIDVETARARPTGLGELDRVLGGGLVPGAVVLLAGEPGVGKSTLLLEVANRFAESATALVVTGEESAAQVRLRAERTNALHPRLYLAAETDLAALLGHVDAVRPGLLVVDSVQTVTSALVEGSAGGPAQVRAVAAELIALAKHRDIAIMIVGHVTKDGAVAGPRALEHLVDVVLHFDGERHSTLRLVRAVKNRFGPADEVGCFALRGDGIEGLPDPSGLFLSHRTTPIPGTCVTVTVEGRRPLLAELQSLVTRSTLAVPRRAVSGLDGARVAMVLAVLERRGRVNVGASDVFAATVGGMRVAEPAADLALALAVASAAVDAPLPVGLVALGEVGLSGEIRPLRSVGRRLAEASRLGFTEALAPVDSGPVPSGMRVTEVPDIGAALALMTAARRGVPGRRSDPRPPGTAATAGDNAARWPGPADRRLPPPAGPAGYPAPPGPGTAASRRPRRVAGRGAPLRVVP